MALVPGRLHPDHVGVLPYPHKLLNPSPAPVLLATAARGERRIGLRCDDLGAGNAWAQSLGAEGLQVQLQTLDERAPADVAAQVLHLCGRLAEHLGRLRSLRAQMPSGVLLLAVRGLRDLDQVLGLEMGADDVIDTDTAAPVVAARLRAQWRRGRTLDEAQPACELRFGSLELLCLQRQARLCGRLLPLTEGEFEVLWLLAVHAGRAVSRRELLRSVRGLDDDLPNRSIDSRVYRIRAKLGDGATASQRIRTVRNHGYAFCPTGW